MRILWHMPTLRRNTCGLSRRAIMLARELMAHGHTPSFLVRKDRTDINADAIEGVPLMTVDVPSVARMHWCLQSLARRKQAASLVARIQWPHDCFISCQPEAVAAYRILFPDRPACFICGGTTILHDATERARQRALPSVRRVAYSVDRLLKHWNEKAGFYAADTIIFDSESTRLAASRFYGLDLQKSRAIYGGVDLGLFRPPTTAEKAHARQALGADRREFVITWTGRLSPEKNVDLLIHAVARCKPCCRVFLVGEGDERPALRALVSSLGLQARIIFCGAQQDVRPYLHAADAFVFPSVGESFGGSLAEAMACGLPCVALRSDGRLIRNASAEILQDGACGRLVQGNDPERLADAIAELAADPELCRRLGMAASRRAREVFNWRGAGLQLNALLSQTPRMGIRSAPAPRAVMHPRPATTRNALS